MKEAVMQIAREVRAWAESQVPEYDDLCGWCAICSAEIWRRLAAEQIKATLHLSRNWRGQHAFVIVDGYIVDVTATQFGDFGRQKVVMIHEGEGKAFDFYESEKVFKDAIKFRDHIVRSKWPPSQQPFARMKTK